MTTNSYIIIVKPINKIKKTKMNVVMGT